MCGVESRLVPVFRENILWTIELACCQRKFPYIPKTAEHSPPFIDIEIEWQDLRTMCLATTDNVIIDNKPPQKQYQGTSFWRKILQEANTEETLFYEK